MQEFLKSEKSRAREQKTKAVELGEYCRAYINSHKQFDWFIKRYYGPAKVLELWNMAEDNQEEHLRNELNAIWFELPDSIFNIRNNPEGWEAFLKLVEE